MQSLQFYEVEIVMKLKKKRILRIQMDLFSCRPLNFELLHYETSQPDAMFYTTQHLRYLYPRSTLNNFLQTLGLNTGQQPCPQN